MAFAQTVDGTIRAGAQGGGLRAFRGGRWTTFSAAEGLADPIGASLTADPDGSLRVGTDGGLTRLRNGPFSALRAQDGLASDRILALHEDAAGVVEAIEGTAEGGLAGHEQMVGGETG